MFLKKGKKREINQKYFNALHSVVIILTMSDYHRKREYKGKDECSFGLS